MPCSTAISKIRMRWRLAQAMVPRVQRGGPGKGTWWNFAPELAPQPGVGNICRAETPTVRISVDSHMISAVVSGWTGVPVGKMLKDEIATTLTLESHLRNHASLKPCA